MSICVSGVQLSLGARFWTRMVFAYIMGRGTTSQSAEEHPGRPNCVLVW